MFQEFMLMLLVIHQSSPSGPQRSGHTRSCVKAGVENPCRNGAICRVYGSATRGLAPIVTCQCSPAWMGAQCELERDPCTDGSGGCGSGWDCTRNASNAAAGYDCACARRPGYRRLSESRPQCVDIDECALLMPACHHGGTCHNGAGTFSCRCQDGFRGPRCGERLSPTRSPDGWRPWSRWSPCCDGQQARSRICRRRSGCEGDPEETHMCSVYKRCPIKPNPEYVAGESEGSGGLVKPSKDGVSFASRDRMSGAPAQQLKTSGMFRAARKVTDMARYWKLLHYLGFEPVLRTRRRRLAEEHAVTAPRRRKRSLSQIESYDDFETRLVDGEFLGFDVSREERAVDRTKPTALNTVFKRLDG